MMQLRRQFLLSSLKGFDIFAMVVAFSLATQTAYFHNLGNIHPFGEFLSIRIKLNNILLLVLWGWGWKQIFTWCELYHTRRLAQRGQAPS